MATPKITLREEKLINLVPDEGDGNFRLWKGATVPLTIASGIITVTGQGFYTIDTEGAASTDALTRINGAAVNEWILIRIASNSRTVTMAHGTFLKLGSPTLTLNNIYDSILFQSFAGNVMVELHRVSIES